MTTSLSPVTITSRYPAFRSGRLETWSAVSTDGRWTYERLEITGTPWEITDTHTGEQIWAASLPKARRWTAQHTEENSE
jgi:hypothetical protein